MEEIMLSMSFTDEEAEAIKKAFAQTKQYPPLEDKREWGKRKYFD